MENERLSNQCEVQVSYSIKRLLKIALEEVDLISKDSNEYSETNLLLNIATGFLCCIAHKSIPKEAREVFIERLKYIVNENFEFMDGKNE